MEKFWADREQMGGFERNVFRDMARFDQATAQAVAGRGEEADQREGRFEPPPERGRPGANLLALARDDVDEALARLPKATMWDVDRVVEPGRATVGKDKAKALRAAEEAAARARGLDAVNRPWGLAQSRRHRDPGRERGRREEAAGRGGRAGAKLPADRDYYRGWVAAAVVAYDEPAAFHLVDGFTDADRFNEAVVRMIDRLADTDPARAEGLFAKLRPVAQLDPIDGPTRPRVQAGGGRPGEGRGRRRERPRTRRTGCSGWPGWPRWSRPRTGRGPGG